jgi:hypothetical protein
MFVRAAGLIALAGAAAALPSDAQCLPDWSDAVEAVNREHLLTLEDLVKARSRDVGGQIVKSTLCRDKSGSYFYHLVVRDGHGRLKTVSLGATNPASTHTKR